MHRNRKNIPNYVVYQKEKNYNSYNVHDCKYDTVKIYFDQKLVFKIFGALKKVRNVWNNEVVSISFPENISDLKYPKALK